MLVTNRIEHNGITMQQGLTQSLGVTWANPNFFSGFLYYIDYLVTDKGKGIRYGGHIWKKEH